MRSVTASHDGICLACQERIVADIDEIVYSDADGGWIHLECVEAE